MRVHGFATMIPEVTGLDFNQLELVSELEFKEAHRKKLLDSLNHYLADVAIFEAAPRIPQVRDRLKKIKKCARELSRLLESRSELGQAVVYSVFPFYRMNPLLFVRVLNELAMSSGASARDLEKGKSGRPSKAFLDRLLLEVGEVFDAAGGKGIGCYWKEIDENYQGSLLELVCELLKQAKKSGGPNFRRNTIAQKIKEIRS